MPAFCALMFAAPPRMNKSCRDSQTSFTSFQKHFQSVNIKLTDKRRLICDNALNRLLCLGLGAAVSSVAPAKSHANDNKIAISNMLLTSGG